MNANAAKPVERYSEFNRQCGIDRSSHPGDADAPGNGIDAHGHPLTGIGAAQWRWIELVQEVPWRYSLCGVVVVISGDVQLSSGNQESVGPQFRCAEAKNTE